METTELLEIISRDEDSRHQFKADVTNETSLGQEMVAFSNFPWVNPRLCRGTPTV